MRKLPRFSTARDLEQERAVAVFAAGLPDYRRSRIVTASSDLDSWKHKPAPIERRLAAERAWR